ncbi:MAG: MaoC/PaaZ C-terminal domain-containing protein [Porticoccaceae bacterium]
MNLDALRTHKFDPIIAPYTDKDVMLYALSLGVCNDPLDRKELPFVYEKSLVALPSITAILAYPGPWITNPAFDVNFVKLLHGEQRARFFKPLPPTGEIRGEFQVQSVADKGEGKGALVYFDKLLYDNKTGDHLATVTTGLFLRGDGGCGSFGDAPANLPAPPERAPDFVDEIPTSNRAALLYRLNSDRNPIHVDPDIAEKAGFGVPILHGLCTYGICGFSVLRNAFGYDTAKMGSLDLRFSAPVLPGETLVVEGWKTDDGVAFQAKVKERDKQVISNGFCANA